MMYNLDNTKIKLTFMHLIEIKSILNFSKEAILIAERLIFQHIIKITWNILIDIKIILNAKRLTFLHLNIIIYQKVYLSLFLFGVEKLRESLNKL